MIENWSVRWKVWEELRAQTTDSIDSALAWAPNWQVYDAVRLPPIPGLNQDIARQISAVLKALQ